MKVPLPLAVLVIGVSLVVVGAVFYSQITAVEGEAPQPIISAKLPYQTEEAWKVTEVTQTLADLVAFAEGKKAGLVRVKETEEDGVYEVRTAQGEFRFDLRSGIWQPKNYAALAEKVSPKAGNTTELKDSAESASALQKLLEPSLANLLAENRRISDWLTREPGSAAAHAEAALLLGTIGLNDQAGLFRDPRRVLNRMVAHLALARALGISESDETWLAASGLLLTLTGNQSAALVALEAWPESEVLEPWENLLRLRNTNDWRLAEGFGAEMPSALRNEVVRAKVRAIAPGAAVDYLQENEVEPDVAIWRMFNEVNLGVGLGHIFTKPILEVEFGQSAEAAKFYGLAVEEENAEWVEEYLDTPAARVVQKSGNGPVIEVAGRDIFADYHQRHLLGGFAELFAFVRDRWAVPEEAEQLRGYIVHELPDLRLKPFLVRNTARCDQERCAANPAAEAVIFSAPETVTPELWAAIRRDQKNRDVSPAPDFHGWFSPEVPRGTAFELGDRLYAIGVGDENDLAWLEELWERAPYNDKFAAFGAGVENGGRFQQIPAVILDKWFARVLPYNLAAMEDRAVDLKSDPEAYAAAMEQVVRYDPNEWLNVAEVAKNHGRDELREKALLEAFAGAEDRVWMANESRWLVQRLQATGQVEKAREVADAAAEVFSYRGLEAALWLAEVDGRWGEAMDLAKKIDGRYNKHPSEQVACYLRMKAAAPMNSAAFHGMDKKIFPKGLSPAALSDFVEPPTRGVRIGSNSPKLEKFGLKPGEIVVAVDGYRVHSVPEYSTLASLRWEEDMTIIAWDGQKYREITGVVPNRFFNVDLANFLP